MALTPSTENYTLGRGKVFFNRLDGAVYDGLRDLGNVPAFNMSVAIEKLDHFSSRSGLKAKDKIVVTQLTPTATFTLDEVNEENLALTFMADITTTAISASDTEQTVVAGASYNDDRAQSMGSMDIGMMKLQISGASGAFDVGEIITGGTSSETATVLKEITGYIIVGTQSGAFTVTEVVTGGTSTETATVVADSVFDSSDVSVNDGSTTVYTIGTDYYFDSLAGLVTPLEAGSIVNSAGFTVDFDIEASSQKTLTGFANTSIEGEMWFVPDNPVGSNKLIKLWTVSITPTGEAAFIGDEWQNLEFETEILKDETGHPTNPYLGLFTNTPT